MLIPLAKWAESCNRSAAAARNLIRRGKLPEAVKMGRDWFIEDGTPWPADNRFKA